MTLRRRDFLGTALAGAAGLVLTRGRTQAGAVEPDPTALVPLGRSLRVCRVGAGTGMRGGGRQTNQTRLGRERLLALLRYEYDQALRLFDCADLYGTHPYLAEALKDKPRDSYQIVSKMWLLRGGIPEPERPDADVCVARFLKELQTDYIDLVQFHCMSSPKWPEEFRRQMDILEKLKAKGTIRAHGVSCHSLAALKAAAAEPWVDVIHARINPFRAVTDGPMEEVLPVLKAAHDAGKGIIGMKIVGEGRFNAGQLAESIKFALGSGVVDVMIAGFESNAQVDQFKSLVRAQLAAAKRES